MIRFYLGEEPILPNVPTYRTGRPEGPRVHPRAPARPGREADERLRRLRRRHRPRHATNGHSKPRREAIRADPAAFVAQPLIRLSTCPTVIDGEFQPRRVDLRPFVVFDGSEPWVLPGGLTRVALQEGSFIVNSSQGGGSKDTWVLNGAA